MKLFVFKKNKKVYRRDCLGNIRLVLPLKANLL